MAGTRLHVRHKSLNFGGVKNNFIINIAILAGSMMAPAMSGCSGGTARSVTPAAAETKAERVSVPQFSADSAMANAASQVAFGPRVPGSDAHRRCAEWLGDRLKAAGADTVMIQTATLDDGTPMRNIFGRFDAGNKRRILLLAHYDTRPWADEDPDPANRTRPIDGANDGASGVAVLLETARLIGSGEAPRCGVDILLVDVEDSGNSGEDDSWARGSQYFADNMPYGATEPLPEAAILLDMVGGRDARFCREMFSQQYAAPVVDAVWRAAREAGHSDRFTDAIGGAVNDDHLPFLRAGIPAIDIIETTNEQTGSFNPTWHTMADNLDNLDAATLKAVGETVVTYIYNNK